jgi:general secretion pathway protein D
MPGQLPSRGFNRNSLLLRCATVAVLLLFASSLKAQTQSNPANAPASIPAGLLPPVAPTPRPEPKATAAPLSAKQRREADDAYLDGAKQVDHKNFAAAEHSFERAVQLNPTNRDYALALIVARESLVTELVQSAAKARLKGDTAAADALLNQARTLDPNNRIVAQHFETPPPTPVPFKPGLLYSHADPSTFPAADIASTLAGPVEFAPTSPTRSIHLHGDPHSVIRSLYSLFGITTVFDSSYTGGPSVDIDIDKATFAEATRILSLTADIFAVAVQPRVALIAKDTQETRDQLSPQVEETVYLPGLTNDQIQELANVARNIFDVKQVSTSATGGYMLLRGDEQVLHQVNATYDDMLDGGSEVLFDVNLYELDKTTNNNIGGMPPASFSVFDLAQTASNLINSNQSIINEAIANGLLTLTGNPLKDILAELGILAAAGVTGVSEFTTLAGYIGTYDGLPLLGVSAGASSFNLLLNSTDSRLLDAVQIRSSSRQPTNFRAGSRYPVITGTYTSGISGSLPASLAGLNINGTSAAALLAQYAGSSNISVPQFQYEDLGITLKLTPQVQHNDQVFVALDMKIVSLGGSSINNIPILNNRSLTSSFTLPVGHTAMIAGQVSTNELKSLTGLPGLSELPGFQGTDQDREKDSTELLITITPHIVRSGRLNVASRRLATVHTGTASSSQ